MIIDPIGDLLIRLKNASAARKDKFVVPHSRMKHSILAILKKEGVVEGFEEKKVHEHKLIEVTLPPSARRRVIPELRRASKPGRRLYVKAKNIPRPLRGLGLVVLSTPQGVMTGRDARRKGVGGEILLVEE